MQEWSVTERNLRLHRWLQWLGRKLRCGGCFWIWNRVIIIPSYSSFFYFFIFYFSVSDSCNILSSSSSSCLLIFSSSAWARAESSMARRRSVSVLDPEGELAGLVVSPYSTSTPSGILLEWHWQRKCEIQLCSVAFTDTDKRWTDTQHQLNHCRTSKQQTVPFTTCYYITAMPATLTCVPTCHSGYCASHQSNPRQRHPKSPPTMTQTSGAFKGCSDLWNEGEHRGNDPCVVSWLNNDCSEPGRELCETPGDSDGWRTAGAPRRCWTRVCVGCLLAGGNWQAPQTLQGTLEREAVLDGRTPK